MDTRAHPSNAGALRVRATTLKAPETTRTSRVRFAPVTTLQRLQKQRDRIVRLQRRWEGIKTDLSPQFSRKHSMYPLKLFVSYHLTHCLYSRDDLHRSVVCDPFDYHARSRLTHFGARFLGGVIGTGLFLGSAVRGPSVGIEISSDLILFMIGRSAQWRPHRSLARVYDSRKCGILPLRFDRGDVSLLVSSSTLVIRNSADIPSLSPNVGGVIGLADLYVDPALGFSLGWAAWVSHASYVISVEAHTD